MKLKKKQLIKSNLVQGVYYASLAALLVACGGGERNPTPPNVTESPGPPLSSTETPVKPDAARVTPTTHESKVTTDTWEAKMTASDSFVLTPSARQLVTAIGVEYYVSPTSSISVIFSPIDASVYDPAHAPFMKQGGMIVVPWAEEAQTVETRAPEVVQTPGGTFVVYGEAEREHTWRIKGHAAFPFPNLNAEGEWEPYRINEAWNKPSSFPLYLYTDPVLHPDMPDGLPDYFPLFRDFGDVNLSKDPVRESDIYSFRPRKSWPLHIPCTTRLSWYESVTQYGRCDTWSG